MQNWCYNCRQQSYAEVVSAFPTFGGYGLWYARGVIQLSQRRAILMGQYVKYVDGFVQGFNFF